MSFLDQLLGGIKRVLSGGTFLPAQPLLNFIGFTVADDPSNGRTNVTAPSGFTPGGDLAGSSVSQTVIGFNGKLLDTSMAAPSDAQAIVYSNSLGKWAAVSLSGGLTISATGVVTLATISMGGDVTGNTGASVVAKWLGVALDTGTLSSPASGAIPVFDNISGKWKAGSAAGVFTPGGDLTGTSTSQTVAKVNGATVGTAGGSLTTGKVLRVTGGSAIDYGAVDLANVNAVTGVLPAANQAAQAQAGDVTGNTGAAVVAKVNGTSVPATPAIGNLLQATGTTSTAWVDPTVSPTTIPFPVFPTHKYQIFFGHSGPNGTAEQSLGFGGAPTFVGTVASPALTTTSKLGGTKRVTFSQSLANRVCGFFDGTFINAGNPTMGAWRGNAANRGGFVYRARFAISAIPVSAVLHSFVGFAGGTGFVSSSNYVTDTAISKIGMGFTCTTTAGGAFPAANWQLIECSESATHLTDLTSSFALTVGDFIEIVLYCAPNDSKISYQVTNLTSGAVVSGVANTSLPLNTRPMMMTQACSIDSTYASGTLTFDLSHAYSEWFDG